MTTAHFHAIVWIDHREAKIFHFNADDSERTTVTSHHPGVNIHHKANSGDSGHVGGDKELVAHGRTFFKADDRMHAQATTHSHCVRVRIPSAPPFE